MNNKQTKNIYTDAQTQTEEQTKKTYTPEELISAINNKKYTKVRRIIKQGIDLNIQDEKTGDTPLILAIKTEDKKMVKILLDAKADPNQYNIEYELPLDYSLDIADNVITELLLEYKADINKYKYTEGIPSHIFHAVKTTGDISRIKYLLAHGANIDDKGIAGETPLIYCISSCTYENYNHNIKLIKFLLENGADPNKQDNNGWTPLHTALDINDNNVDEMEIIKILLQYGADVTIENNNCDTPIFKALCSNMKAWHLFDYITNYKN